MAINMGVSIDSNLWGCIAVAPLVTLRDTAVELEHALGVEFYEDDSGRFEEFPAYCAENNECEFVLLGIPDKEEYLGEEPLDSYQLQIKNSGAFKLNDGAGLASHFLNLISSKSFLKCWIED
jgi:hypothetical protein